MTKSNNVKALELWRDVKSFMDATAYSLTAITLGLRKGEAARKRALKPSNEWAPEIEWWFEFGVALHPIYEKAEGPAKALIVGWALQALKDWLNTIKKG